MNPRTQGLLLLFLWNTPGHYPNGKPAPIDSLREGQKQCISSYGRGQYLHTPLWQPSAARYLCPVDHDWKKTYSVAYSGSF